MLRWAGIVLAIWLALDTLLVAVLAWAAHRGPRARTCRPNSPTLPSWVQGHDPEIEVGRPAAPGAAPPGRPMHSHACTTRAEHVHRLR